MKIKIRINEDQIKKVIKSRLLENLMTELISMGSMSSNNNNGQNGGAVEISKQDASNLTNIQKYTSKGIDVKVMGEENGLYLNRNNHTLNSYIAAIKILLIKNDIVNADEGINAFRNIITKNYKEAISPQDTVQTLIRLSNDNDIGKYRVNELDNNVFETSLGEEQAVNIKHRFEGKDLNIFSTRDKVTLREVLNYVNSIPDQPMVEDSFSQNKVNLYVKVPSSGRYKHLGSFTPEALSKFREVSDREAVTGEKSDALNEEVSL